jgi:hypothetical protein
MLTLEPESKGIVQQDVGNQQANLLIIAAFSTAVHRAVGDEPSIEATQKLIQDIRGTYVKAEDLQPVQAEAVVRGLHGERELLKDMPYVELARTQLSLTYGIVQLLDLKGAAFEEFLDESLELAQGLGSKPKPE